MGRRIATSFMPVAATLAAFFLVLPSTGADLRVSITGETPAWSFDEATFEVDAGARVAFTNRTEVTHTADCAECPWSTGDVQPGETVFVVLDQEGTFAFQCRYHPQLLTGEARVSA